MTIVTIGDTVELNVAFTDSSGAAADPTNVALKVLDEDKREIHSAAITSDYRTGVGAYTYKYTVPAGYDVLWVEWSGEDSDGMPVVPPRNCLRPRWGE